MAAALPMLTMALGLFLAFMPGMTSFAICAEHRCSRPEAAHASQIINLIPDGLKLRPDDTEYVLDS